MPVKVITIYGVTTAPATSGNCGSTFLAFEQQEWKLLVRGTDLIAQFLVQVGLVLTLTPQIFAGLFLHA